MEEEEEEEGDRVAAVSWNLRRIAEGCAARRVHPDFSDRFSFAEAGARSASSLRHDVLWVRCGL